MCLELPASDGECDVGKPLVVEQRAEVVREPALRHFELHHIALPADVYAVRHDGDFTEYR